MSNYYTHITKTPLSVFKEVLLENNIRALVIDGNPTDEQLSDAWFDLRDQFAQSMGDADQLLFLKLIKEVNHISAQLNCIYALIEVMQCYYAPQFGKMINEMLKMSYTWDPQADKKAYLEKLSWCRSRCRGIEMQKEIKEMTLKSLEQKLSKRSGKPTYEYFDSLTNAIEEHFSVKIDDTITVSRFCDRVKRMIEQNKKIKYR